MYKSIAVVSPKSSKIMSLYLVAEDTRKTPEHLKGDAALEAAFKDQGFMAEASEISSVTDSGIWLGVGSVKGFDEDRIRSVGSRVVSQLSRLELKAVKIDLTCLPKRNRDEHALGRAFAEGLGIGNWRMDMFNGAASRKTEARGKLTVTCDSAEFRKGMNSGLMLAEAMNLTRRMAATPPNICTPSHVATTARMLARGSEGLSCTVITYQQARRLGMGGLENVGKGSANKPCMVILDWKPSKPQTKEKLALVGKSITYDTGGYSMKSPTGMKGMKYDKNGGMAVLGAMKAISDAKLPIRVFGVLPAAENMVSSDAYRPDDIISMYNDITVEVTNTDAEGRLVLADALAYTCRKLKPTAIVDIATLTGGVVVALGHFCAGYWCENGPFGKRIEQAATHSGEKVWRMPLWEAHRDFMRSEHADLLNSNPKRSAHPIQGAAFLSHFVDEDIPWGHIDIAGTSALDSGNDVFPPGPTGWGVRLMYDLAEGYVKDA